MTDRPRITGRIRLVTNFGHALTDLTDGNLLREGFAFGDRIRVQAGDRSLEAMYGTYFGEVDGGEGIVMKDPDGECLMACINFGRLSETLGVSEGDWLTFLLVEKGGMLEQFEARSLGEGMSLHREDYGCDEAFANFREVTAGRIRPGRLFRSASPFDPTRGRNETADRLAEKAGIRTCIDLSGKDPSRLEGFAGSFCSRTAVLGIDPGLQIGDAAFSEALAELVRFIDREDTPVLIFCLLGQDRTGAVLMLLEALCGASVEEIVADYMVTYENHYHIERDSKRWKGRVKYDAWLLLERITGEKNGEKLTDDALKNAAEALFLKAGLDRKELEALRAKLTEK